MAVTNHQAMEGYFSKIGNAEAQLVILPIAVRYREYAREGCELSHGTVILGPLAEG